MAEGQKTDSPHKGEPNKHNRPENLAYFFGAELLENK